MFEVVEAAGLIGIIGGAYLTLAKIIVPLCKKIARRIQDKRLQNNKIATLEEKVRVMGEKLETGLQCRKDCSGQIVKLTTAIESLNAVADNLPALQEANIAVLHERLHYLITRALERGYSTYDEVETVIKLYNAYEKSNGNGTMPTWIESFNKLEKRAK